MYRKQRRFITPVFLLGLLVLSFFSTLISPATPAFAADPYTAESNGGSCKTGDTPYDEAGPAGKPATKMCRPAEGATQTQTQTNNKANDGDDSVTCAVEKIGWILCPVMEGASKASDKLFHFLAGSLLEVEPELFKLNNGTSGTSTSTSTGGTATTQNGTYLAWSQAKDLANIAFIVAFVIIVISQVTSYGISNYGIKRMLPRLIVAAIAVNVSYFICQAMADISNVMGYSIHQGLLDIAAKVGPAPFAGGAGSGGEFNSSDGFMAKIAIAMLAVAGAVWLFMAPLGAVLLFVIITVATITVILLLRKAFIVLLVVASPLAFVAYLLPNTEQYFQKWLSMFWKLLLVFPIVALLMGGGTLASAIILSAGAESTEIKPQASCKSGDGGQGQSIDKGNACEGTVTVSGGPNGEQHVRWSLGLIATGVAVAPLLAVWSVLQGALSAAGAIGGKMAAAVSRAQDRQKGSLADKTKKRREFLGNRMQTRALDDGKLGKALNAATLGGARRGVRRQAKYDYAKSALNNAKMGYIADEAVDGNGELTKFGKSLAGGRLATDQMKNKVAADAVNAQFKLEVEEVKAAHALVDNLTLEDPTGNNDFKNSALYKNAIGSANDPKTAAALEQLAKIDKKAFLQASQHHLNNPTGAPSQASRAIGGGMSSMGYFGGGDVAAVQNGGGLNLQDTAIKNLQNGGLSSASLAQMSNKDIDLLGDLVSQDTTGAAKLQVGKANSGMSDQQADNLSPEKKVKISRII